MKDATSAKFGRVADKPTILTYSYLSSTYLIVLETRASITGPLVSCNKCISSMIINFTNDMNSF